MLSNRDNYRSYLKIDDYLQDTKIYGLNSSKSKTVLYDSNAQNDAAQTVTSDGNVPAADGSNVVVKVDTTDANKVVIRVHKDYLMTNSDNVYLFPIEYNVKTGNELFNDDGRMYANYKVTLTAYTYSSMNSKSPANTSYATDHLIYTNARVNADVFEN